MGLKLANNGSSLLAGSVSAGATTITVATGEGAKFPPLGAGDWFPLTLVKLVGGVPVYEIVRVTARTGDAMTVTRAQEGTTATTFSAGDKVEMRATAGVFDEFIRSGSDVTLNSLTVGNVTGARLKGGGLAYSDNATSNALNVANGAHQRWAPNTGAQVLTITGWPAAGTHGELLIEGVNLGAATITWPTIQWMKSDGTFTTTFSSAGVTLQTSGTDFVLLWTRDGGTTVYGKVMR